MAVTPSVSKAYRVVWYETRQNSSAAKGRDVHRREVFEVKARSTDTARALAKTYVAKRGYVVSSVSFSQRPNELVIYTPKKDL